MLDKNKVQECVEEWLENKDYFLVSVKVSKSNKVVVEIDNKDGVWIDDCCDLSRFIEDHFDREVEDYELEVGSAGIGQPLKVLQQYINNVGNKVEAVTDENKKCIGILTSADENGVTIDGGELLTYEELKSVKVIIEFDEE